MRYLIALFALGLAWPHPAAAQAYDWRPVNRQTATLLRSGQFDAALPLIEAALADCPNAATSIEAGLCTAIFSENLASVREHQGDLAAAEAGLRKTLAVRTAVLPPDDPLIGQAHFFLALFFERHGRREEEIAALEAAEAIARSGGAAHQTELSGLITRHALALAALGRPADALPLYQQAYAIARDSTGATSRDALAALGNLFTGQIAAGHPDAAIEAVSAVLAAPDADSFDPTQRALLAGKLAMETTTAARSKVALGFVKAALPDLDNGLVTDADASFTLLRGAARLSAGLGDPNQAVALARRARDVAAAKWGPTSFAVSNALRTEAEAEANRHDIPAAIARLTEASAILNAPQFGISLVQVEVERGKLQSRIGHAPDAIAAHLALIASPLVIGAAAAPQAAMLAMLGEDLVRLEDFEHGGQACDHATQLAANQATLARDYTVKALLCSGNAAIAMGRTNAALEDAGRAKTTLWDGIAAPDEPNPVSQFAVADLRARALRDGGRTNEALAAYRDTLTLAEKTGDAGLEGAAQAQIASLQHQLGRNQEADETAAAALSALGPDGPRRPRANLLNTRALVAVSLGHHADAVPLFEASLAVRRQEEAPEPLAIATSERDLAASLSSLGRNVEAGRHMDVAIEGFRALGEARRPYLVVALDRRVAIANAAGDPHRAETALRELLPLQDPASDDAAGARLVLAGLLDNQAHRNQAATLRSEALAIVTAKHGANSPEAFRVRLADLAALRASGRLADAADAGQACLTQAASIHDVLLACLLAQAETALEAGDNRDAVGFGARAVVEAETHWTQNGANLLQALLLQARAAAALDDVDFVLRLYDRIHTLTPEQGLTRGWTDFAEGKLLVQAGEPSIGLAMLRLALDQANHAHDTALAVAATGGLAERLVDTGHAHEAVDQWQAVLPLLSEDTPVHRVTVLEGLATAAAALGEWPDAARMLGEAVALCRAEIGAGSPTYGRLATAWAEALLRSGEPDAAEDALRLLDADASPLMQRQRTIGMLRLAGMASDPVAAILLARSLLDQAQHAFGPASVGAAFARLDLIEALVAAGKHVDPADLDAAAGIVQAQDPGWRSAYRIARLRGLVATRSGRFDDAAALFVGTERLVSAHEGPASLNVAMERSNRASAELLAGHAEAADRLYGQALDLAAPSGQPRNTVWAQIAGEAAVAAERVGEIGRAIQLRRDADALLPPVTARHTIRWL
jgi:tetratricopeptide (TPR) repeat protein